MKKNYRFCITGLGAEGTTFIAKGDLDCEFVDTFREAMRDTFSQLTHGRAVYGSPGVGCSGPYSIQRLVIEETQQ